MNIDKVIDYVNNSLKTETHLKKINFLHEIRLLCEFMKNPMLSSKRNIRSNNIKCKKDRIPLNSHALQRVNLTKNHHQDDSSTLSSDLILAYHKIYKGNTIITSWDLQHLRYLKETVKFKKKNEIDYLFTMPDLSPFQNFYDLYDDKYRRRTNKFKTCFQKHLIKIGLIVEIDEELKKVKEIPKKTQFGGSVEIKEEDDFNELEIANILLINHGIVPKTCACGAYLKSLHKYIVQDGHVNKRGFRIINHAKSCNKILRDIF